MTMNRLIYLLYLIVNAKRWVEYRQALEYGRHTRIDYDMWGSTHRIDKRRPPQANPIKSFKEWSS